MEYGCEGCYDAAILAREYLTKFMNFATLHVGLPWTLAEVSKISLKCDNVTIQRWRELDENGDFPLLR